MQNSARGSVEGKGTWKGGALSQSLPLLAHSSYHSKGPGLMSKATTGTSALKGISAEKLLARKGLGVKFWAAYLLKGMGMLLLGYTHSSHSKKSTASLCLGCPSVGQRSSEQRPSKAVLSLGHDNVEGVEPGKTSAKQNLRP